MKTKIDSYDALVRARKEIDLEIEIQETAINSTIADIKESLSPINVASSIIMKVAESFNWAQIGIALIEGVRRTLIKKV